MKLLLKALVLLVVIIIIMSYFKSCGNEIFIPEINDSKCKKFDRLKFLVISGVIDSVYEDKKSHLVNTVEILTSEGRQKIYLEYDKSGLFNYLKRGDSIQKAYGKYEVKVGRSDSIVRFNLDYGCN